MYSFTTVASLLTAFTLVTTNLAAPTSGTSAAVSTQTPGTKIAAYYGQAPNQPVMETYCNDDSIDIFPIGFVIALPDQPGSNGYPTLNFGNQCYYPGYYTTPQNQTTGMFIRCQQMIDSIQYCQGKGKKVLLSIGGDSTVWINNDTSAQALGTFLWQAFGTPNQPGYTGPRPFGDLVIDGFDFDIESDPSKIPAGVAVNGGYAALANQFRSIWATEGIQRILTAAPQCIVPDSHLDAALQGASFDYVFIQFYNTASCSAGSSFYPDFGNGISYDAWASWLSTNSLNKDIQAFIGLAASTDAVPADSRYYIDCSMAKTLLAQYGSKYPSLFGGVMLYDATYSARNNATGQTYAQCIRSNFQSLWPASGTTTVTVSTASTTSSTIGTTSSVTTTILNATGTSTTSSATILTSTAATSTTTTTTFGVIVSPTLQASTSTVTLSSTPLVGTSSTLVSLNSTAGQATTVSATFTLATPSTILTSGVLPTIVASSGTSTSTSTLPPGASTTSPYSWGPWSEHSTTSAIVTMSSAALLEWGQWSEAISIDPATSSTEAEWDSWPLPTRSVQLAPSSRTPDVAVTVVTTSYIDVCPTGFTTVVLTTTLTIASIASQTDSLPDPSSDRYVWPTFSDGLPSGFYAKTTVCSSEFGPLPTTVTLTIPIETVTRTVLPITQTAPVEVVTETVVPVTATTSITSVATVSTIIDPVASSSLSSNNDHEGASLLPSTSMGSTSTSTRVLKPASTSNSVVSVSDPDSQGIGGMEGDNGDVKIYAGAASTLNLSRLVLACTCVLAILIL